MILSVKRLETSLPRWLELQQMQWGCWAYALWQLWRRNPVILCILSWIPFQFRKKFLHKRYIVVLVPPTWTNFPRQKGQWDGDDYFANNREPTTFQIIPTEPTWPAEWRVVKFGKYHYFTTRRAMDMMAKWMILCKGDEEGINFVEVYESSIVGERLTRKEAYERILSDQYYVYVIKDGRVLLHQTVDESVRASTKRWGFLVPSEFRYIQLSTSLWGMLGTLPTLIQACGYSKTSNLLTFIIIFIDFNRRWLFYFYEHMFFCFRVFVKSRFLKNHRLVYVVLSQMFGLRWLYTDQVRECSYFANVGDKLILHNFSRLQNLEDISIYGSGYGVPLKDCVLRIWDGRAFGIWPTEGEEYALATLNVRLFVE